MRHCSLGRMSQFDVQTPPYDFQKVNFRAKAHVWSCGTLPLLVYCETVDRVDRADPGRCLPKDYLLVALSFARGARHGEESYNCGAQRHTHGELSLIAEWSYSKILVSKLYCAVSVDRKPCCHKDKGRYTIQLGLGISIEIRNDTVCREIAGSIDGHDMAACDLGGRYHAGHGTPAALWASHMRRGTVSRSGLTASGAIPVKGEMISLHSQHLLCC
jgi:hypothetical protein